MVITLQREMTKKSSVFFLGKDRWHCQLPPRVTPTLVTPLNEDKMSCLMSQLPQGRAGRRSACLCVWIVRDVQSWSLRTCCAASGVSAPSASSLVRWLRWLQRAERISRWLLWELWLQAISHALWQLVPQVASSLCRYSNCSRLFDKRIRI